MVCACVCVYVSLINFVERLGIGETGFEDFIYSEFSVTFRCAVWVCHDGEYSSALNTGLMVLDKAELAS
ncbi:hypothetical protein AYI69_g11367 [Smittium culicis]|uniref:Uncharacterized protein n=1 Tax=Smittium culicis TaxID=133412 RepID=A0A1R1WZA8_9FUNG|nr:hypothetical protein AYI69_g11367 [Smittium culicis]